MKCPNCGNEPGDENRCKICGGIIQKPEINEELEVEYKEFKVSELLEIHKKPSSHIKDTVDIGIKEKFKKQEKTGKFAENKNIIIYVIVLILILILSGIIFYSFKK